MGNMRIIELQAENVKRLRAVRIKPDRSVVEITGRNAQGKTSVLDSIMYALAGERSIPAKPIRNGEEAAKIRVSLGDGEPELIVERRFTASGSVLAVYSPDGAKFPKAQAKLNDLVGSLSFDPLAFSRMEPRKQADTLRALAGLDFAEIDRKRAEIYERRRDRTRDQKALEARANGIEVREDLPDEPIDVAGVAAEIEEANRHNATIDRLKRDRAVAVDEIAHIDRGIADGKDRIAELEAMIADIRDQVGRLGSARAVSVKTLAARERAIAEFEPIDVAPLRKVLAEASETNAAIVARQNRDQIAEAAAKAAIEVARLSDEIDEIDRAKAAAIASAPLPVPGLGLDDAGVTFNGIPFDQCSAAEQLRISVAMGLALNPRLRVMLVRDGSLLDADALRLLAEIAEENDAQIWLECVAHGEPRGIVIEDGEVIAEASHVES